MYCDKNKIERSLERLRSAANLLELQNAFKHLCRDYLINHFALARFLDTPSSSKKGYEIFTTYPEEWIEHYQRHKYYLFDPVYKWKGAIRLPFSWAGERLDGLSPVQQKLFSEAADFNIKMGTTIPMLPHGEKQSFLTILDQVNLHPEVVYVLSLAVQIYEEKKASFQAQETFRILSQRELEILELKSQGHPVKVVADLLKISEATVVFHLKNIRRKFHSPSIEHTLFQFGIIKGQVNA